MCLLCHLFPGIPIHYSIYPHSIWLSSHCSTENFLVTGTNKLLFIFSMFCTVFEYKKNAHNADARFNGYFLATLHPSQEHSSWPSSCLKHFSLLTFRFCDPTQVFLLHLMLDLSLLCCVLYCYQLFKSWSSPGFNQTLFSHALIFFL